MEYGCKMKVLILLALAAAAIAAPWRNSSCVYNLTIEAVLDAL